MSNIIENNRYDIVTLLRAYCMENYLLFPYAVVFYYEWILL